MAHAFIVHDLDARVGAHSLFNMAMDKLRRNAHLIWETNETPLHILIPICRAIENPDQLGAIEDSSPHLRGQIGDIWLKLMKRNIAGWDRYLLKDKKHSDGRPWTEEEVKQKATYRTYQNTLRKARASEQEAQATMRQAIQRQAADQRSKETRIVDRLPAFGAHRRAAFGEKYEGLSRNAANGALTFAGGSRTRTGNSQGVMKKIHRELKEQRLMKTGGSLSTPAHLLQEKAQFMAPSADKRSAIINTKGPMIVRRPGKPVSTLNSSPAAQHSPPTKASTPTRKTSSLEKSAKEIAPTRKRTPAQAGLDEAVQAEQPPPSKRHVSPPKSQQRKRPEPTYLIPSRRKR